LGFGSGSNRAFVNFLSIAKGSNDEVRSQSYRAYDFKYIDESTLIKLLEYTDKISRFNAIPQSPYHTGAKIYR
jgi:four helix bundle protein